jgi:hypothetical protein
MDDVPQAASKVASTTNRIRIFFIIKRSSFN